MTMSIEETYRQISLTQSKQRKYELYRHLRKLQKQNRRKRYEQTNEPAGTSGKTA